MLHCAAVHTAEAIAFGAEAILHGSQGPPGILAAVVANAVSAKCTKRNDSLQVWFTRVASKLPKWALWACNIKHLRMVECDDDDDDDDDDCTNI